MTRVCNTEGFLEMFVKNIALLERKIIKLGALFILSLRSMIKFHFNAKWRDISVKYILFLVEFNWNGAGERSPWIFYA